MKKKRDEEKKGRRKGGMKNRRDLGLEGYRKGVIQERRVQDRRDAEQERCWTGGMQER